MLLKIKMKNKELVGQSDNSFIFEDKYDDIFCYGKEVNDFHTLDKQNYLL